MKCAREQQEAEHSIQERFTEIYLREDGPHVILETETHFAGQDKKK